MPRIHQLVSNNRGEKLGRNQQRSKQSKLAMNNNQTLNTRFQRKEVDIVELKDNIRQMKLRRKTHID
jgi:hypothetical protein